MQPFISALRLTAAVFAFFMAVAGVATAQSDAGETDLAPLCVTLNTILKGQVVSGHEVHFELRDGTNLVATLARDCPQLKFHGRFTYDAVGGRLCTGEGRIVARSGEACLISGFSLSPDAPDIAGATRE